MGRFPPQVPQLHCSTIPDLDNLGFRVTLNPKSMNPNLTPPPPLPPKASCPVDGIDSCLAGHRAVRRASRRPQKHNFGTELRGAKGMALAGLDTGLGFRV